MIFRILASDLKRAQRIRQHNISNAQQELVQQRRLHSVRNIWSFPFNLFSLSG